MIDTKLKCPFCQQELLLSSYRDDDEEHQMWNCLSCQLSAQRKLWQELIRTRKALDVAVDALDRMAIHDSIYDIIARNAMKRINEIKGDKDA